jgi:AraC family transcriptional regulator
MPFRSVPSDVHFAADGQLEGFRAIQSGESLDVRSERVNPMRVAFIRHVGPYSEVGKTWGRLMSWAGRQGLLRGRPSLLGIVYDDPEVTPPKKIRYDACIVVDGAFQAEGEIGLQEIGGGEFAVTTHHGQYDRLSETYAQLLGQWLPGSGRELGAAPGFEIYRNAPTDTMPSDLRTDIYIPLAAQ